MRDQGRKPRRKTGGNERCTGAGQGRQGQLMVMQLAWLHMTKMVGRPGNCPHHPLGHLLVTAEGERQMGRMWASDILVHLLLLSSV